MKKVIISALTAITLNMGYSQSYITQEQQALTNQTVPTVFNYDEERIVNFRTVKNNGQYYLLHQILDKPSGTVIQTNEITWGDPIVLANGIDLEPITGENSVWLTGSIGPTSSFEPFAMKVDKDGNIQNMFTFHIDGLDHSVGLDIDILDKKGYIVGTAYLDGSKTNATGFLISFDSGSGAIQWNRTFKSTETNDYHDGLVTVKTTSRPDPRIYVGGHINKDQNNFPGYHNGTYYIAALDINGSIIAEDQQKDWGHHPPNTPGFNPHFCDFIDIKITDDGKDIYAIGFSSLNHSNSTFHYDNNLNLTNSVLWPIQGINSTVYDIEWYDSQQNAFLVNGFYEPSEPAFYISKLDMSGIQWIYEYNTYPTSSTVLGSFEPNNLYGAVYSNWGAWGNAHHVPANTLIEGDWVYISTIDTDGQTSANPVFGIHHRFNKSSLADNSCYQSLPVTPVNWTPTPERTSTISSEVCHFKKITLNTQSIYISTNYSCNGADDKSSASSVSELNRSIWDINKNLTQTFSAYDLYGRLIYQSDSFPEVIEELGSNSSYTNQIFIITNRDSKDAANTNFEVITKKYQVVGN